MLKATLITICFIYILWLHNLFGQSKNIDSLLNVFKTTSIDSSKADILNALTYEYQFFSISKALECSEKALSLSENSGYKNGMATSFSNLGNIQYSQGNYDTALDYYFKAREIYIKLNNYNGIASSYSNAGNIYYSKDDYPKALENYNKAIDTYKESNNKKGIGSTLGNIGNVYAAQANYEKALDYHLQSLKVREEIGDKAGISFALNNIANSYFEQKLYDNALEFNMKSLKLKEELGDKKGISGSLTNIGNIYFELKNYNKAMEYDSNALKIREELGDKRGIASSLNNIGGSYQKLGNYNQALSYHLRALKIREEIGSKRGVASSYLNIGSIYYYMGQYEKAIPYYEKSLNTSADIGASDITQEAYYYLSETYANLGNYHKAYNNHRLFLEMKDSLINEKSKKNIIELQTKYETELKEKEISVLQKEKVIKELELNSQKKLTIAFIVSAIILLLFCTALFILFYQKRKSNNKLMIMNQKLATSEGNLLMLNQTKNKFFSIISHDLRGPLFSIRTSLKMYIENNDVFTKKELEQLTKSILDSVDNVSKLFENLLTWSRTEIEQIQIRPVNIDLYDLVQENIQLMNLKLKQKQIVFSSDIIKGELMVFSDKNMLRFVIRNLIDNAIKFTMPEGKIEVNANVKGKYIEVAITDDGVGILEENIAKLFTPATYFSTLGTNNEKGTGLGLMLCSEFVNRNGGSIWVESKDGKGSIFFFTIPIA